MKKNTTPVFKRSLFSWVFSDNLKLQIILLLVIVVTVFARVVPLEMQKRIINLAINLRKIDLLFFYCGIYLVSVVAASGLKYLINILQTLIGQRSTARMRKETYHHILTLPLSFFRKTQPGMVVSSLINELATAGDFIGMAVSIPITSILTLLAFAGYLLWLNPLLAMVSMSIYPFAFFLLPLLQKRANRENKKRVDITRNLSSRIAESISGIHEIQGNGAFRLENHKYDILVEQLMKTRIVWNLYRFGIKVTNNFFMNLSPFLIFVLGGYLAINGRLELGALVAFLSAQEKLYDPWKELIEFYQAYQEAAVNYTRTMEYFAAMPEHALEPEGRKPYVLESNLVLKNVSFVTDDGIALLKDISFSLGSGQHMALIGFSGSGKSTLALCIGQLYKYTGGEILIGDRPVAGLTKKDITYNIGFVSQSPFIFDGTIQENLLYACSAKIGDDVGDGHHLPTLDDMIEILQQTGFFVDVLGFGLNSTLNHAQSVRLISQIIRIREKFQDEFGHSLSDYVEFFDPTRYLEYSCLAENLTFGASTQTAFQNENLTQNPYFLKFIDSAGLTQSLLALGSQLAKQTIDILGHLTLDDMLFSQSPIRPNELAHFITLTDQLDDTRLDRLAPEERQGLLTLALRFTPGIHKMIAMPQPVKDLVLKGRVLFRKKIMADHPDTFAFYDMSGYIFSQTILNNIFFGKTKGDNPVAQNKINQSVIQLLVEEDFLEPILYIGLQFQVGTKGDKLSGGQRQKLAIARVLLKTPRLMIMDEATSGLDNKSQARIQNLLETRLKGKTTLIAVAHRLDIIKNYDRIGVMKAGKLAEMGTYSDLMARKGLLYELVTGKK
ncbi:MAG: ABC transporter ATP-binding protein/permease [Desulfobacterales bacterium]|nr:ABC transporter ATP-binding protein/permease [Desulfobacterales bacterium]